MYVVSKRLDALRRHLVGSRLQPRPHCVRMGPSSPLRKGHSSSPLFSAYVFCGHGRPSQLLLSSCLQIYVCFWMFFAILFLFCCFYCVRFGFSSTYSAFNPQRDGKWVPAKVPLRLRNKARYGSLHLWINVLVAGKIVSSLFNTCRTWAL